jgi:predicted MFS family arabinose efflux permease
MIAGALLLAIALLLEGLLTQAVALAAARMLQGAGFIAIVTALMPLMVLCIPREKSGQAFGWVSLIRLVPYAAIPPLYELFHLAPAGLGVVLRWSAPVALIPILLLYFVPVFPQEKEPADAGGLGGVWHSLGEGKIRLLLGATLLVYASYAITFFFLKGRAREAGFGESGLFFTIATLVMLAARLIGGPFFDRYSKSRTTAAALLVSAAATTALAGDPTRPVWFLLAFACGLGWGVAMPLLNAIAFALSQPAARGLNQNLLFLAMQGGFFLGPWLGGGLLSLLGYRMLFAAAGLIWVLAALLVWALGPLDVRQSADG